MEPRLPVSLATALNRNVELGTPALQKAMLKSVLQDYALLVSWSAISFHVFEKFVLVYMFGHVAMELIYYMLNHFLY